MLPTGRYYYITLSLVKNAPCDAAFHQDSECGLSADLSDTGSDTESLKFGLYQSRQMWEFESNRWHKGCSIPYLSYQLIDQQRTRNAWQSPVCSPPGANACKARGYWTKVHQIFITRNVVDRSSAVLIMCKPIL